MTEDTRRNPFAAARILVINARKPEFTGKVDDELLAGLDKKIVRATQDLLNRSALQDMGSYRNKLARKVGKMGIKTGIPRLTMIPERNVAEVNRLLQEAKEWWKAEGDEFVRMYPDFVQDFSEKFPDYYRQDRYPTQEQVALRFGFSWNWFAFSAPETLQGMTAEEVEEQRKQFLDSIEEMQTGVFNFISSTIKEKLEKAIEGYDKNGETNRGVLRNVGEFLKNTYDGVYSEFLFSDKLKELIEGELAPFVTGINRERVQSDFEYQAEVINAAEAMKDRLDTIIEEGECTDRALEF